MGERIVSKKDLGEFPCDDPLPLQAEFSCCCPSAPLLVAVNKTDRPPRPKSLNIRILKVDKKGYQISASSCH